MTMAEELAQAACGVTLAGLTPAARARLDLCVLANLTVGVAGVPATRIAPPSAVAGRYVLLDGSAAERAEDAAFYNGCAMHARTQDDFHPVGNLHLATIVLPAALAAAQEAGCTGERFLEAVAAGYQVAVGISRPLSAVTTPRGLRSTTLYAPFGATAAVARIHGLDAAATARALGLATSLVGGTTQCWVDGSDDYQMHAGQAAEMGLRAVRLTRAGMRGALRGFEGSSGLLRAFAGLTELPEPMDLDASRAIEQTVLKRYPVSGICQPIVYLGERLAAQGVRADDIEHMRIEMNPQEMRYPGNLNRGPFHSFSDVLMSAACCLASVMVHGRLDFQDLMTLEQPRRQALIGRIEIAEDPTLGKLSDRIEVRLRDGRVLRDEVLAGGDVVSPTAQDIDPWSAALWAEAGRGPAYPAFRAAVDKLETHGLGPVVEALRV